DQAGGRFAVPGVGVREQLDEFFGRRFIHPWVGTLLVIDRRYPPDATPVAPARQVQVLLDDRRDALGMLNHLAIHIQDKHRAIGSLGELYRAEPDLFRRQELAAFVHTDALEAHAIGHQLL